MPQGNRWAVESEKCAICNREINETETACVLDDQVVCRECHDRARPICPYCQVELPNRPVSKGKCTRCNRVIVVRKAQQVFPSIYLTIKQAKEVDRYKSNTPTDYGSTQGDFAAKRLLLERQLGKTPSPDEVIAAVNDDIPATDAQLSYARGVGLQIPDFPKKNELSWLLHRYECLRWEIKSQFHDIRQCSFDDLPIPPGTLGAMVSFLLEDETFMSIVNKRKRGDFEQRIATLASRKRIAEIIRLRWADYLQ
jgi:hypothetical protein